jgi:hypothetical protein
MIQIYFLDHLIENLILNFFHKYTRQKRKIEIFVSLFHLINHLEIEKFNQFLKNIGN